VNDIESARLILRLLPLEALAATAARENARLEAVLGLAVPEVWYEEDWLARMRLEQIREDALYAPWSIRAIAFRDTGEIIGSLNCHHRPMAFAASGKQCMAVEIGYSIFAPWQRRGFGYEAIKAFAMWAGGQGVEALVLAISPQNEASLALARKFSAELIGSQIDEKDGPEDIYLARLWFENQGRDL
jgi:[ribosomal protein S5]-alanine N-acetyltransferase